MCACMPELVCNVCMHARVSVRNVCMPELVQQCVCMPELVRNVCMPRVSAHGVHACQS